jgi:hypothetical protein
VPKPNKKDVLDLAKCKSFETRTNLVLTSPPGVGNLIIDFDAPSAPYVVCFYLLKLAADNTRNHITRNEKLGLRQSQFLRLKRSKWITGFDDTEPSG